MPSGTSSQANIWDSKGPYTWPGNNLELWGNVTYDGAGSLTYTWTFGAGEGSATGTVANSENIAAYHTYNNTGSYVARLTVTDGTETDTDTVYIDVVPASLDVRVNLAIQKGLKYLYLNKISTTVNGEPAYTWNGSYYVGAPLAVLAFENHGHLGKNDKSGDIYADVVDKGLNYIVYYMRPMSAAVNPPYDSDINGNGLKIYYYNDTNYLYVGGIATMAIAGSASPLEVIGPEGYGAVAGMTYKQLLEDMVDYLAYAQNDSGSYAGGWRYYRNYGSSDNSVGQWPLLGLAEAEKDPWGITAPEWVKTRLVSWINYSQGANGGFGYTAANSYANIAKTGAGIAMIAYAGSGGSIPNAINFVDNYWNVDGGGYLNHYHLGYHYATYAVKKGMEYADLSLVGAHDWQEEYNQWYVDNQYANGSWPNGYWITTGYGTTLPCSFGLLVLAPLEACKPLADAGDDQEVSEGDSVVLDGSASSHTCPNDYSIVSFEWDFDYNGVDFDVDGAGETSVVPGYDLPDGVESMNFTVALRVTDNVGKISTDTLIVTVSNGNVAPVADAGGPYLGGVGENITLNGLGSYDDNAIDGANPIENSTTSTGYDEIVLYQWDIDGDGLYGIEDTPADPEGAEPVVNFGEFMGTKIIGLKVTDSFGRSSAQSTELTTVAVSDLYPLDYELVSNRYNRYTRQFTVTWRVYIRNDGNGAASNVTATLTPGSIPAGVTVNDDSVMWSGTVDPGEIQLSDDSFSYTYPRGGADIDLTVITWDIEFQDQAGIHHVIRSIPQ